VNADANYGTRPMDSISNKLEDLEGDVARRDAVLFRMHFHELGRRGLYDAELDALTRESWSTGYDEDVWRRVAERLDAVTSAYNTEKRLR